MKNKVSTTFHLMEFDDYLKIIHVKIKENKDVRGYRTLLAQAAGCQLSYLSQVLAESVQLTPEHAAGLAVFWNFSMVESEYFMGLVNKARTSSPVLKELIESRLQELRKASTQIEDKIKDPRLDTHGEQTVYYSNWLFSAVHMIVSIPGFQTESTISERLMVPASVVKECLQSLERNGAYR